MIVIQKKKRTFLDRFLIINSKLKQDIHLSLLRFGRFIQEVFSFFFHSQTCRRFNKASVLAEGCKQTAKHAVFFWGVLTVCVRLDLVKSFVRRLFCRNPSV